MNDDEVSHYLDAKERLAFMHAVNGEKSERKWIEEHHGASYIGGPWSDTLDALRKLAEARSELLEREYCDRDDRTIEERWECRCGARGYQTPPVPHAEGCIFATMPRPR